MCFLLTRGSRSIMAMIGKFGSIVVFIKIVMNGPLVHRLSMGGGGGGGEVR